MQNESRPNPDELLVQIKKEEQKKKRGKLKIYLGMSAGVGKTFAMLQDASRAHARIRNSSCSTFPSFPGKKFTIKVLSSKKWI